MSGNVTFFLAKGDAYNNYNYNYTYTYTGDPDRIYKYWYQGGDFPGYKIIDGPLASLGFASIRFRDGSAVLTFSKDGRTSGALQSCKCPIAPFCW